MKKSLVLLVFGFLFLFACSTKYKVTFDIDENAKDFQIVLKGECIDDFVPEKEGYDFLGWYYDDKPFDVNEGIYKNMTLSAKWSPIEVFIRFYVDEENEIVKKYNYGDLIKSFDNPVKEDYIFLGWFIGEEKFEFNSIAKEDLLIEAKMVLDSEYKPTLKMSFNSTGAHIDIDDVSVTRLDEFKDLPVISRENYVFLGWYLDDCLVEEGDIIKEINDFTLIAKWESIE